MGFAASQARLLLLTARKSDLEFRAQQITNAEMMLAMQTEEVARDYSNKLSNQTLKFIDPTTSKEVELNAANFQATTGMILQEYGGKDDQGNDIWNPWKSNGSPLTYYIGTDKDGKVLTYSEADYNEKVKAGEINAKDFTKKEDYSNVTNNLKGPAILAGIQNGSLRVITGGADPQVVDVINGTSFSVAYNTADDQQADADYRNKTAALQVKEKRLQMDLQQVEAQQKACDTEIDSVKKIMDKNIERTFKVFS